MPQREDTAHTSGDLGEMMLGVRNDTPGTLAGTSGDYAPVQLDSEGMLRVIPHGNYEVNVFPSAARTSSANSSDQTNHHARGVRLHLDITAASGTSPTLDVKLQAKIGSQYIDIAGAAFAQKTTTGTDELVVYPGVAETANESVSDIIPRTWRAVATIGGTTPSFTFRLDASYVL